MPRDCSSSIFSSVESQLIYANAWMLPVVAAALPSAPSADAKPFVNAKLLGPAKLAERPSMIDAGQKALSLTSPDMAISAEDRAGSPGSDAVRRQACPAMARVLQATSTGEGPWLALLASLLAFLSVYPLSMLLYGSLHSTPPGVAGTFNLDGYRQVLTRQSAGHAAQYRRNIARQDHPLARARRAAGLDSGAHRHADFAARWKC